MSEGHSGSNVTRLQEVRRRRALRRLRRLVLVLAAAGLVALYFTGAYSQAALAARETFDSVRIALSPGAGWPVKTGIPEVWQAEPLSGGFVLLGEQDVGVWSGGGTERAPSSTATPARSSARATPASASTAAPATSCGWRAAPTPSTSAPLSSPSCWPR